MARNAPRKILLLLIIFLRYHFFLKLFAEEFGFFLQFIKLQYTPKCCPSNYQGFVKVVSHEIWIHSSVYGGKLHLNPNINIWLLLVPIRGTPSGSSHNGDCLSGAWNALEHLLDWKYLTGIVGCLWSVLNQCRIPLMCSEILKSHIGIMTI